LQFNDVIQSYPRTTFVAMVTKFWEFYVKVPKISKIMLPWLKFPKFVTVETRFVLN